MATCNACGYTADEDDISKHWAFGVMANVGPGGVSFSIAIIADAAVDATAPVGEAQRATCRACALTAVARGLKDLRDDTVASRIQAAEACLAVIAEGGCRMGRSPPCASRTSDQGQWCLPCIAAAGLAGLRRGNKG